LLVTYHNSDSKDLKKYEMSSRTFDDNVVVEAEAAIGMGSSPVPAGFLFRYRYSYPFSNFVHVLCKADQLCSRQLES
jgi:hypothetical protein